MAVKAGRIKTTGYYYSLIIVFTNGLTTVGFVHLLTSKLRYFKALQRTAVSSHLGLISSTQGIVETSLKGRMVLSALKLISNLSSLNKGNRDRDGVWTSDPN